MIAWQFVEGDFIRLGPSPVRPTTNQQLQGISFIVTAVKVLHKVRSQPPVIFIHTNTVLLYLFQHGYLNNDDESTE